MPTGTIKKLVSDRGFGFIAAEDGKEYFFHRSGLDSSLNFDSLNGGESRHLRGRAEPEGTPRNPRAGRLNRSRSLTKKAPPEHSGRRLAFYLHEAATQ